jgi:hypothetical protein
MDLILNRKIGAFELLIFIIVWAIIFGSRLEVILACTLCAVFWFSKRRFGGEFSVNDLIGLWNKQAKEKST